MKTRTTTGLFVVGLLALAACDESPTDTDALDQSINFDAAMVSADATIEDVQALRDAHLGGFFMNGRSGTRSVTFYDASDVEQAAYDEMTTAKIQMVMEMTRELEREGWSASATRSREMTVTGLEGVETTRTVNGSGSEAIDPQSSRPIPSRDCRTYEMSPEPVRSRTWCMKSPVMVRIPSPARSRATCRSRSRQEGGTETRTREVVITFNGTQYPEMTVDGEMYEVDLEARDGQRPFRGGGHHGGR